MRLMELHNAIFNRIEPKLPEGVKVFDYLPPRQQPPMVVLGKMSFEFSEGLNTKTDFGYEVDQKMHIITKTKEKHFAIQILKSLKEALCEPLEVEGAFTLRQTIKGGNISETEEQLFYAELDLNIWLQDQEEL